METDQSCSQINNNDGKRVKRHGDNDGISALPDDVLLDILQSLDLRTAVRTGALARRWRRLPCLLPDLVIDVASMMPRHRRWDFSPDRIMTTYTNATTFLLLFTQQRRIRRLRLAFYLIDPYLRSIGDAVAATTADRLEFTIHGVVPGRRNQVDHGERFTGFLTACPGVFARLTSLTLYDLCFSTTSEFVADLLNACNQLELLSLNRCEAFDIVVDAPSCSLLSLEIHACFFIRVELTRVPKLERVLCDFDTELRSVRFGYVPCLRAINLSAEHQIYCKNPIQLSPAFHNLRDIYLFNLDTPDMVWIIFVLEAAPFVNNLSIKLSPHWSKKGGPYRTNKAEETPKFEHRNLSFLKMKAYGISQDTKVMHYIRLVREVAVCLKRIHLLEQCDYKNCDATCLCQVDESRKTLLRDILTIGFSSSIEILIEPVTRHKGRQTSSSSEV
ncbi:unnamed protein product [Alopecurus aequalis]